MNSFLRFSPEKYDEHTPVDLFYTKFLSLLVLVVAFDFPVVVKLGQGFYFLGRLIRLRVGQIPTPKSLIAGLIVVHFLVETLSASIAATAHDHRMPAHMDCFIFSIQAHLIILI